MSRKLNSLRNATVSIGLGLVATVVGFATQRFFVQNLGIDYLGVHGLFTNIISMLAVAELGIGSAIIYHLYRPLHEKDLVKIQSIMKFYKTCYRFIALTVLILALGIMPFLSAIVGHPNVSVSLNVIYMMFIGDVILSYLLSYKRSILYADQKNYVINIVRVVSITILNILQIIVLIKTQNYYLFLALKIISTVVENLVLNYIVGKQYPFLKNAVNVESIDKETRGDIFQKVKGLLYHKSGTFVVLGSDNIIISVFLGIATVGLYSNYLLVLAAINGMVAQLSTAITASIGNLLLSKDKAEHFLVYQKVHFANFWISTVVSVSFFVVMDSFVALWIGERFVLTYGVLVALSLNLYLALVRSPITSFKTAAGIFHEDRYMPIIESIINIIVSIVLLQFLGLAGVFIGTLCSTLFLHLYSYPKYVYSTLFDRSYTGYYKELLSHLSIAMIAGVVAFVISRSIAIDSGLLKVAFCVSVALIITNGILFVLYRKSKEFQYFKALLMGILKGRARNDPND